MAGAPLAGPAAGGVTSMRPCALAVLAFTMGLGVADAEPRPEVAEATVTVMRQLEAFRRDDFGAAYELSSATIKEIFDRPTFETLARRWYAESARPAAAGPIERTIRPHHTGYPPMTTHHNHVLHPD